MAACPQDFDLSNGQSVVVPTNWRSDAAKIKIQMSIVSGTAAGSVEFTSEDIRNPAITPVWRPTAIAGAAAATDLTLDFTPRAIRFSQAAVGVVRFSMIEAGGD